MANLEEKYAKFLITDEMKVQFEKFSHCHEHGKEHVAKVIVQTTHTKKGPSYNIRRENADDELV